MADDAMTATGSGLDVSGYVPPDARFGRPFIDVDEERDGLRRMRYIHGGFDNTDTRFSFYFPPKAQYAGRFFQFLEGGAGGREHLLASTIQVGLDLHWVFEVTMDELGGYCVESNQGHFPGSGLGFGNDIELYAASAQCALFSKYVAQQIYGETPHHGYIWGVSGGGARSGHCLEQRPDIWQGGSPHAGMGQSTHWSPWALTWLVARKKIAQIIDAIEPGGGGDPFVDLSHQQRQALAELYRRGYPRGAETQLGPFGAWAFPMYGLPEQDPTYFEDFWAKPGYLGHDDPRSLDAIRVSTRARVTDVLPASRSTSRLAQMHARMATAGAAFTDPTWSVKIDVDVPERDLLFMSKVKVLTGKAAGRELLICSLEEGGMISPFSEKTPDVFDGVVPGDELEIDNKDFIAFAHYHLYSIANSDDKGGIFKELAPWAVDGHPVYPQRETPATRSAGPLAYTAKIKSKMIYVQPTLDNMVWPTTIPPYHDMVRADLGDRIDDHFRMWFVENACHGAPDMIGPNVAQEKVSGEVWKSRLVSYDPVTAQVLRDLVGWVERGVEPHSYADYQLGRDNRLILPKTAAERRGVQPIAAAEANGGMRAEVKVGQVVDFVGRAEQPPGAGTIVGAEWDFEGDGAFTPAEGRIDGGSASIETRAHYAYARPGVYFACFRASGHCDGAEGRGPPVQNIARVRVVVRA